MKLKELENHYRYHMIKNDQARKHLWPLAIVIFLCGAGSLVAGSEDFAVSSWDFVVAQLFALVLLLIIFFVSLWHLVKAAMLLRQIRELHDEPSKEETE